MTTIEVYQKTFGKDNPEVVDAMWKDSLEVRERIHWLFHRLNTESPAYGCSHDWNAARSAMSMHMDDFDKAFQKFYDNPTMKTATKWSDAISAIGKATLMAKHAMFQSEETAHWLEVKDEIKRKYGRTKEGQ